MEPILVVAAIGAGFDFCDESFGPFLPGEEALLRELDGEREGLRFPRFGKYGFRLGQDSRPTYRCIPRRAAMLRCPTVRGRRNGPNKRAAAFRPRTARWCRGTHTRRGEDG